MVSLEPCSFIFLLLMGLLYTLLLIVFYILTFQIVSTKCFLASKNLQLEKAEGERELFETFGTLLLLLCGHIRARENTWAEMCGKSYGMTRKQKRLPTNVIVILVCLFS